MSYKQRTLNVEFTLAEGTFDNDVGDTLTAKNFKCEASIAAYGGPTGTVMDLSLWGLSLDKMAKLTANSQKNILKIPNSIKLYTDDECVYSGTIVNSRINLNNSPDAPIEISAMVTGRERLIVTQATSIKGVVDVGELVKAIAFKVGLKFSNVDVNIKAKNPHYKGNAIQQIQTIASDYGFTADIDIGLVVIYTGKNPIDSIVPSISTSSGLIGYPIFYDYGINFRCMYSSSLRIGRKIILDTSLPNASGEWIVSPGTTHYLSCNMPGGLWETFVVGMPSEALTSKS